MRILYFSKFSEYVSFNLSCDDVNLGLVEDRSRAQKLFVEAATKNCHQHSDEKSTSTQMDDDDDDDVDDDDDDVVASTATDDDDGQFQNFLFFLSFRC